MSVLDAAKYPLVLLVGYLVTYSLTPFVARAAGALGIVDKAGPRRIHKQSTPRAGGLALFAGFHAASAVLFVHPWYQHIEGMFARPWWLMFLLASSVILLVGLIDDIAGISAPVKLCGQTCTALLMYCAGINVGVVFGYELPAALNVFFTVLWFVTIINAFNLIDGYDGLAAGLAAIAALGLAGSLVFRDLILEALFMLGFIGACIGFLRYNLYPARIFLGDCGSMLLGFTLATVTLATSSKGTLVASVWVPMLALGVPVLDVVLAVWRRSARRALTRLRHAPPCPGIMSPDLEHIHHRLAREGLQPRNVTAVLYLLSCLLVFAGLISLGYHHLAAGGFLSAVLLLVFVVVRLSATIEMRDSRLVLLYVINRRWRMRLLGALNAAVDLLFLSAALLGAITLLRWDLRWRLLIERWSESLPLWVILPFACLYLLKAVHRYRRRRKVPSSRMEGRALFVSIFFSAVFTSAMSSTSLLEIWLLAILYGGLAAAYVSSLRMFVTAHPRAELPLPLPAGPGAGVPDIPESLPAWEGDEGRP